MAPSRGTQAFGVVVGETAPLHPASGDVIPFLAGYFAGLAAYADGRVGEECTFSHEVLLLNAATNPPVSPRCWRVDLSAPYRAHLWFPLCARWVLRRLQLNRCRCRLLRDPSIPSEMANRLARSYSRRSSRTLCEA